MSWKPFSSKHVIHHNKHLISKHLSRQVYKKPIIVKTSSKHILKPVDSKHGSKPIIVKTGSKNILKPVDSKHGSKVIPKPHGSVYTPWVSTKPLITKKHKVIVYANKNVGQCSKSTKAIACWKQRKCIKYIFRHGGYSRSCIQMAVQRICNLETIETCKFCTKYYLRKCHKFVSHHHGHHGIVKCNKRSVNKMSCTRQINQRYYQYNKIVKQYLTNKKI